MKTAEAISVAEPVERNSIAPQLPIEISSALIAIVDDEPLNVRLLSHQLYKLGYKCLLGLSDSMVAIESLKQFRPDVVLMDLVMPRLSGTELLERMRRHPWLEATPAIVLTASQDRGTRLKVLELGVADFLNKPVDQDELSTRLRNVIEAKRYRDGLKDAAKQLERAVRQRTQELEASRREVVLCLARAAEYRDDNTGQHVVRVGRYAAILAQTMKLSDEFVEMIELAAQLHDVGKIGIPDGILHKPGRLIDTEMELMRRHAEYGWNIIAPLVAEHKPGEPNLGTQEYMPSPLLVLAAKIAASHHERWDGKGYPNQVAGEDIPLEARITAVADVFDALSTARRYKPAFELARCSEIIFAERGRHFDPQVVDAFIACEHQLRAVYHELADEADKSWLTDQHSSLTEASVLKLD